MPLSETAGRAELNVTEIDGGCSRKKRRRAVGWTMLEVKPHHNNNASRPKT